MVILEVNGIYRNGIIALSGTNGKVKWGDLSLAEHPELPDDCKIELIISLDKNDFLSGKNGIVWATFDIRQAEVIHNSLIAQNINTEVEKTYPGKNEIFLIKVTNQSDVNDAMDFIWKSESGLHLKPDWTYSENETNKSFELWLSEH